MNGLRQDGRSVGEFAGPPESLDDDWGDDWDDGPDPAEILDPDEWIEDDPREPDPQHGDFWPELDDDVDR